MSKTLALIIQHLQHCDEQREQARASGLLPQVLALQAWQCKRLLLSHNDLMVQKRFQAAMQFFVDELYGPKDFSQRDQDVAKVVPKMAKLLPDKALHSLESALHLNDLSMQLDIQLSQQLDGKDIDRDTYFAAYRACNNQALRQQQIGFIQVLGEDLAEVVHIKGISTLLFLSRKPAKIAGVSSLHEFIEDGFKAFKKIGRVEDFLGPVIERERLLMLAMFSSQSSNPLPEGI
jgi:hypothetical protein